MTAGTYRGMLSVVDALFADCHDVPPWQEKLDTPLGFVLSDTRIINECEKAGVMTIRDLASLSAGDVLAITQLAEKSFINLHDAIYEELGDYLLSRDLTN